MTKEVDDVKKNFLRNTLGLKKEGMMKIVKNFCPLLANCTEFEVLLEKEFSLIFTIKNINLNNHEAYITLF